MGTIVNALGIIAGSLVGLLLKKGLPERFSKAIMTGIGLCVAYIGIDGCLEGKNALIAIISIVVGGIIGELIDLDKRINNLGNWLQDRFKNENEQTSIAQGFVTASLLFCVGAMAIVGSLQSGLSGNNEMLYTKTILDTVAAVVFASSLGFGVIFSSVLVLIYQGGITLLAQYISPYLNETVISEMTCVGSLLIIALSLNILKITNIKVMNYVPAIFLPIVLCMFM